MRLKSNIWVAALVRRVFSAGGYAAVERHGADEAGAIFIRVRRREGNEVLLAPAPQSVFGTDKPEERIFEFRLADASGEEIDALFRREASFDPDFWVLELEVDDVADFLTIQRA